MNELPRIKDANNGLFRRVKVIAFPEREKEKQDEQVKEQIKQEGSGILGIPRPGLRLNREQV